MFMPENTTAQKELTLYRCLVCKFVTLDDAEITEHLMTHAQAEKYAFSGIVKE
jgi:hypothetical protein